MKMHRAAVLVTGLALMGGAAHADLRVIFGFDDASVQVHSVMQLDQKTDFSRSSGRVSPSGMPDGLITIQWINESGEVLAISEAADPRVAHSPNHTNASTPSRTGLRSGAWVSDGPDGAESVTLELPEEPALGLAYETWTLSLTGNN